MNAVEIFASPNRGNNRLVIDGVDVTSGVQALHFSDDVAHDCPTLTVTYVCFGTVTMSGEMRVIHYCPQGDS